VVDGRRDLGLLEKGVRVVDRRVDQLGVDGAFDVLGGGADVANRALEAGGEDRNAPPAARAVRARGRPSTRFVSDRSITIPSSQMACPATACPPPLTDTGRSRSRAKDTAAVTSSAPAQRATSAG
jgi:hypothetical protein